jgi:hypothetical protein
VQQRERYAAGIERLLRETQQNGGVLADRIQHHRPLEFGDDLADDMNAFGLERPQVVEAQRLGVRTDRRGRHAGFAGFSIT